MSLLKYAVAAAIGYFAGQPSGRRQLDRLRTKTTELMRSPQVEDLKQRGKDVAGERASTVLKQVRSKRAASPSDTSSTPSTPVTAPSVGTSSVGTTSAGTGFSGRDIAEERQAARTAVTPPSPVGRHSDDESSTSGP